MFRSILLLTMFIMLVSFIGCDDNNDKVWDPRPEPPQGVTSVTGDGNVLVKWWGPYDRDIRGFIVYRNTVSLDAQYVEIGRFNIPDNPNLDLITYEYLDDNLDNGTTYYYAVASFDYAGQISPLSAEDIEDTPRPEGEIELFDLNVFQEESGIRFSLNGASNIDPESSECDAYVYKDEFNTFFIEVGDLYEFRDTKIQDLGYTSEWTDIDKAQTTGFSELGYFEVITGHTYIIKTDEKHYAKMRVIEILNNKVEFQWAYQTDVNNPQLVAPVGNNQDVTVEDSKKSTPMSALR